MKDWVVLIACGLIGWGVVSWLISVIRPPRQPPAEDAEQAPLRLVRDTPPDAQAAPPMTDATGDIGGGTAAASEVGTSTRTAAASEVGTSPRTAAASEVGTSPRTAAASDVGIGPRTAAASDAATHTIIDRTIAINTGASPGIGMETAWPAILQVDKSATAAEIEKAYHTLLAECDRIRFSTWYSAQERQEAAARRAMVCAAYEFIRPRR